MTSLMPLVNIFLKCFVSEEIERTIVSIMFSYFRHSKIYILTSSSIFYFLNTSSWKHGDSIDFNIEQFERQIEPPESPTAINYGHSVAVIQGTKFHFLPL